MEKTLSIIKPDGVKKNVIGEVLSRFEKSALKIAALKKIALSKEEAKAFYLVHKERPFYDSLTTFMSEGPVVVLVLEGDNAISRVREIMGAIKGGNAIAEKFDENFGVLPQIRYAGVGGSPEGLQSVRFSRIGGGGNTVLFLESRNTLTIGIMQGPLAALCLALVLSTPWCSKRAIYGIISTLAMELIF